MIGIFDGAVTIVHGALLLTPEKRLFMHAGKNYRLKEFLYWTRRDIYVLLLAASLPTFLCQLLDWHWLAIPWVPVALIGTAAGQPAAQRAVQFGRRRRQREAADVGLDRGQVGQFGRRFDGRFGQGCMTAVQGCPV